VERRPWAGYLGEYSLAMRSNTCELREKREGMWFWEIPSLWLRSDSLLAEGLLRTRDVGALQGQLFGRQIAVF